MGYLQKQANAFPDYTVVSGTKFQVERSQWISCFLRAHRATPLEHKGHVSEKADATCALLLLLQDRNCSTSCVQCAPGMQLLHMFWRAAVNGLCSMGSGSSDAMLYLLWESSCFICCIVA